MSWPSGSNPVDKASGLGFSHSSGVGKYSSEIPNLFGGRPNKPSGKSKQRLYSVFGENLDEFPLSGKKLKATNKSNGSKSSKKRTTKKSRLKIEPLIKRTY